MRILSSIDYFYPMNIMKSARPQILLQEEPGEVDELDEEDLAEYARAIGINTKDEVDLLWIAREGLSAKLPPPWRAVEDQPSGQIYYFNVENGHAAWEHPLDAHYRQIVEQERQKRLRSKCVEEPAAAVTAENEDLGALRRPSSPFNIFRQQRAPNRLERPVLRARPPVPNVPSSPAPRHMGPQMPPPWAKPAIATISTPSESPQIQSKENVSPAPSPDPSPINSRQPSHVSDGMQKLSVSSGENSHPFSRTNSPNETLAHTLVPEPAPLKTQDKPRISESVSKNAEPLSRRPSGTTNGPLPFGDAAKPPLGRKPSADAAALKNQTDEEERRLRKDNENYLQNLKERLKKEREDEERRLRNAMSEELQKVKDSMAKQKETEEAKLKNQASDEIQKVKERVRKERDNQENSIREAVKADLQKLRDQLEVERQQQERDLRATLTEEAKRLEESIRKDLAEQRSKIEKEELILEESAKRRLEEKRARIEKEESSLEDNIRKELAAQRARIQKEELAQLEELRRSVQSEITELQDSHRRRVAELRASHQAELNQINSEMNKLRLELDKIRMETADEAYFKKTQIDALERQKTAVERSIQDLRNQETDVRNQCEKLKDDLKALTKEVVMTERVLQRLETERTDLEEDMYMLQRAKSRYVERVEQLRIVVDENLQTPNPEVEPGAAEVREPEESAVSESPAPAQGAPTELMENGQKEDDPPNNGALSAPPSPEPLSRSNSRSRRPPSRNEDATNSGAELELCRTNPDRGRITDPVPLPHLNHGRMSALILLDSSDPDREAHEELLLTSDCVSGFLNLHLQPCERDSDPLVTLGRESSAGDREQIDKTLTLNLANEAFPFIDVSSFVMRSRLDSIKYWMASRRKNAFVFSDPAFF